MHSITNYIHIRFKWTDRVRNVDDPERRLEYYNAIIEYAQNGVKPGAIGHLTDDDIEYLNRVAFPDIDRQIGRL